MLKKISRIPYKFNRQTFNDNNDCITNLTLVTKKEDYFKYLTDEDRIAIKKQILDKNKVTSEKKGKKIIAHAYWYGNIGRKQAFSILSYLATQNLNETEVWLWLDEENGYKGYEKNPHLQVILPYIVVKKYSPWRELKGLICFNHIIFKQKDNLAYRADGFRILVLYKYGGLYFDLDICFLDDVLCLCSDNDWCYAWEKQAYANNALLYFRKESKLIKYLFFKAQRKAPMPWAILNYQDKKLKKLTIYPYYIFDPAWLNEKNEATDEKFDNFFKEKKQEMESYTDFFPGAFAYHWHNRWEMDIEIKSYFSQLEKYFLDIVKNKTL